MIKKLLIILAVMFPVVIISFVYRNKTNFILDKEIIKSAENIKHKRSYLDKKVIIKLKDGDEIKKIELEDYVIGVVSCEMPASFDEEALKAQAVAARTFVLRKLNTKKSYTVTNSVSDQCYHSNEILKKKWGKNYNKYYSKVKNAVLSTKREYLTYDGEIITAFYFSMSNGYTEYSENVFVSSRPYLVSVSSSWDKEYEDYSKTISLSKKEFLQKLKLSGNIENIEILSRYKTNRVNKIKVNNKIFTGVEFRTFLSLRSTDFDIEVKNDKVYITTRGYGHGVGMSQYGASAMANNGYNYKEILSYYYKNVEIKKYK